MLIMTCVCVCVQLQAAIKDFKTIMPNPSIPDAAKCIKVVEFLEDMFAVEWLLSRYVCERVCVCVCVCYKWVTYCLCVYTDMSR
jgi:hypothetical protein